MPEPPDAGKIILEQLFAMAEQQEDDRAGHVVAELAIMSLLIDAKLVTHEQACERLELIQSVLPERYQTDEAKRRTTFLTTWLRGHIRPDGPAWTPQVIEGGKDQA